MADNKYIEPGKSSFNLIDPAKLLAALPIDEASVILDAACGSGAYTLAMAPLCPKGKIFAFDLYEEDIDELIDKIRTDAFTYVVPRVTDLCSLPLGNGTIDICLMASVFHELVQEGTDRSVLREIGRVLKPDGLLAVVEFKKIVALPCPPLKICISPAELDETLRLYGFTPARNQEIDLAEHTYLSLYQSSGYVPAGEYL